MVRSSVAPVPTCVMFPSVTAQDAVHHLNVTCSSHDSASITASLPDPEIISDYAACLETIRLWGVCLFGDREEEEEKVRTGHNVLHTPSLCLIHSSCSVETWMLQILGR